MNRRNLFRAAAGAIAGALAAPFVNEGYKGFHGNQLTQSPPQGGVAVGPSDDSQRGTRQLMAEWRANSHRNWQLDQVFAYRYKAKCAGVSDPCDDI